MYRVNGTNDLHVNLVSRNFSEKGSTDATLCILIFNFGICNPVLTADTLYCVH